MGRSKNHLVPINMDEAPSGWYVCNKCGYAKPPEEFDKDTTRPHGLSLRCKGCRREYHRVRLAKVRAQREYEKAKEIGLIELGPEYAPPEDLSDTE